MDFWWWVICLSYLLFKALWREHEEEKARLATEEHNRRVRREVKRLMKEQERDERRQRAEWEKERAKWEARSNDPSLSVEEQSQAFARYLSLGFTFRYKKNK